MSSILRIAQDITGNLGHKIEYMINLILPPKQRERALENIRTFAVRNPKLASFLAVQTALAGLPIFLFIAFAITTLAVSLVTCVLLGIIAALVVTVLATGFALVFVIPMVFAGSCTASIAFLWGLFGYLVIQRINHSETPVRSGKEVGDALNELIEGRKCDLADPTKMDTHQEQLVASSSQHGNILARRESECLDNKTGGGSTNPRQNGQTNGIRYGGELGEESDGSGARGDEIGTRNHPGV